MTKRVFGIALTALSVAVPLSAQSLFNAAGLGIPLEALEGRARAMGSMGIGLPGGGFAPTDPAALARLSVSTGIMAAQPSWVDYATESGASGSFNGQRFPLLGIAYPLLGGMASVQVGSFMDQRYQATTTGSVDVSGLTVPFSDTFVQDGSVSTLNLGYARVLNRNWSVGVSVGRYAGGVDRTLTRTYGDEETTDVDEYIEAGTWTYRGFSVTVGGAWQVGSTVRVAASAEIPTKLDAEASDDTRGIDRTYALPLQLRAGASAAVAPGIVVTASGLLSDWSDTQEDLVGGGRSDRADGFGVGVELSRARLLGFDAPLRFGFRQSTLPFWLQNDDVTERIYSGGLGFQLNSSDTVVLAGVDLAVERGSRFGGGLTEDFWRLTISLLASGF
jgi:hypothetical protein